MLPEGLIHLGCRGKHLCGLGCEWGDGVFDPHFFAARDVSYGCLRVEASSFRLGFGTQRPVHAVVVAAAQSTFAVLVFQQCLRQR